MPGNNTELNPEVIAENGEKIYKEKYRDTLEKEHPGEFVAIDIETEEIFIGKTAEEALENARKKYPDKIFHLIKIGSPGIFKMGSYSAKKVSHGWVF